MILGVDHVALSSADIARDGAVLRQYGFDRVFESPDCPNDANKRPLLEQYQMAHDLALYRGQTGIAIEMTCHGSEVTRPSGGYEVLLGGVDKPWPMAAAKRPTEETHLIGAIWRESGMAEDPIWGIDAGSGAAAWIDGSANASTSGVRAVAVLAGPLDQAEAVWIEGLQGREARRGRAGGRSWALIEVRGPVAAWNANVILVEGRPRREPMLDHAGFPCLAFHVRGLAEDVARLMDCGVAVIGDAFDAAVAGRRLRVQMLRAAGGELIELIETVRRAEQQAVKDS